MSIVDTKPFMLLAVLHRIFVHRLSVTGTRVLPVGAGIVVMSGGLSFRGRTMGLTQLNFTGLNKIDVAIMRLKEYEPSEGYHLAFSGGKDSIAVFDLAEKAGVKFDTH